VPSPIERIRTGLEKITALEAAEIFLSPYVHPALLCEATLEAGPANWIVNRSDIYDASLEALLKHPIEEISSRAAEKIKMRRATITTLTPPQVDIAFEEIHEHSVEDLLGHPLCPFEAMLFFSYSTNPDHRASSALSLTRRLLEYPPDWSINPKARESLEERFGELLLADPSETVRSYAARVPLHSTRTLNEAAKVETHLLTLARILQNPARTRETLQIVAEDIIAQEPMISRVLALDAYLSPEIRNQIKSQTKDLLTLAICEWYQSRL
jgi:hypothetical protein